MATLLQFSRSNVKGIHLSLIIKGLNGQEVKRFLTVLVLYCVDMI